MLTLIPDLTFAKFQFRNHPDYIRAYEKHLKNPEDQELKTKMELEYNKATMEEEEFKMYLKYYQESKETK